MAKGSTGVSMGSHIIDVRQQNRKDGLKPIPCDCNRCVNHGKDGCRLHLVGKIRNGKCLRFGTVKPIDRQERKAVLVHNREVDRAKTEKQEAEKKTQAVRLTELSRICEANFTMRYLETKIGKGRFHPGNARYEIECISNNPMTIRFKGWKGPRRTYIIIEK